MRVYVDDKKETFNIVQSVVSASTMISSLAARCKEYILSKFPKDYIKHVYIDTSESVTQQLRNDTYNATANKIPYPSMTISPEISLDNPINGMDKALHMSSPNLYLRKDLMNTYNKIIIDPDQEYSLFYTSDYITTNFNFKIATNSFIQNADIAFYLKSRMQEGMFRYINGRHIQTEIPKTFIKVIADLKGYDLNDPDDMDSLRLYLIGSSKSEQTIQKRINTSTGKQCFFIDEHVNFLSVFRDLDCPSTINRESQVEGEYLITFTLQLSTWLPNAFILQLNKEIIKEHRISKDSVELLSSDTQDAETGIYSINADVSSYNQKLYDKSLNKKYTMYFKDNSGNDQIGILVYNNTYMHDLNQGIDPINVGKVLSQKDTWFKYVYLYAKNKLKLDMTSFIYPVVYTNTGLEKNGEKYLFDYDSLQFTFLKNFDSDVAIGIYINRLLYESVKEAAKQDMNYFNDNFMAYLIARIGDKDLNLKVKSFVNDRDEYSKDDEKSLRIGTAYGVGYISLLEDDSNDGYKICVGTNSDGTAKVMKIEVDLHSEKVEPDDLLTPTYPNRSSEESVNLEINSLKKHMENNINYSEGPIIAEKKLDNKFMK